MKNIITLFTLFITISIFAQDPIKIEERKENFSVGMQNSLVANVPLGNEELTMNVVKDVVKKYKGKVNGKEEIFVEQATKSNITDKAVDVYIKVITVAGGKIELAVAVNLGGSYLNKADHPDMYRNAEKQLYEIVKRIATEAVDMEVKEEEKKLKDLEKDLDNLVKDKEKLEKDIEKNKEDIANNKNEIKLNEASQEGTKKEIETLHGHENTDADALKEKNRELEKLVKDKEKLEKKIEKAEEDIQKAKDDIKVNEGAQEEKKKEIETQKKHIEENVKSKYANIK
ncbi:MAG: hypothetical protein KDC84_04130 [Crocinitomicaceae bacterium]|nr:hypothetical protein [Crocinitomicaceae bacterium]